MILSIIGFRFLIAPSLSVVLVGGIFQFVVILTIDVLIEDRLDAPDLLNFGIGEIVGSRIAHHVIPLIMPVVVAGEEKLVPVLVDGCVGILVLQIKFHIQLSLVVFYSFKGAVPRIAPSAFTGDVKVFVPFRAVEESAGLLDDSYDGGFLHFHHFLGRQQFDNLNLLLRLVSLEQFDVDVFHSVEFLGLYGNDKAGRYSAGTHIVFIVEVGIGKLECGEVKAATCRC